MASGRALSVEIVDYAGSVWSGEAAYIGVPAMAGPVGIYPKHQPLLAILAPGTVKVELPDGSEVRANVSGGFLSVDSDLVTVVTDEGELLAA